MQTIKVAVVAIVFAGFILQDFYTLDIPVGYWILALTLVVAIVFSEIRKGKQNEDS